MIHFSESVLQSRASFEQYLASQETIDRIRAEAKKPYVPAEDRLSAIQVAWVTATTPLRLGYFLFLRVIAPIAYYALAMRETGMDLYVESERQLNYNCMVLSNYLFGSYRNILVDVINTVSFDAHEVYSHPKIDLAKLDEDVVNHFHPAYINSRNQVFFDKLGGKCSGMCEWIAYLYFQTKDAFSNPEHHLASIVKQVSNGVGKEAALWQVTQVDFPPVLGLQKRCIAQLNPPTTENAVQELFKRLKPGMYSVGTAAHRMNFVATEEHTYLVEPNNGLVKETPENIARLLPRNSVLKVCEIYI